jgi:LEA14-like dessication related protein
MKVALYCLLLSVFASSCKDSKDPVFENVENIKLGKLGLTDTELSADIRFTNTNGFGFRVKSVDCDLYVDSAYLGHFSNSDVVRIQARQSFVLPMNGQVKSLVLMQQTQKAMKGKESIIQVTGSARVGRMGIYKTIPVKYNDTVLLKDIKF